MGKTSIEWTDRSWNPVVGCSRVSPGCQHCYAERLAGSRLRQTSAYKGLVYTRRSGEYGFIPRWTGEVRLLPGRLDEPLRWRKPQRIFVCDMGDLFHEDVPDEYLDRVFAVMALAPRHTFQVLTKRADRMLDYIAKEGCSFNIESLGWREPTKISRPIQLEGWPLPNVWLGVSVEDQKRADERIHLLLQTPAAVRFVSYEPALGPVDFRGVPCNQGHSDDYSSMLGAQMRDAEGRSINWIIFGGESGPHARPCNVEWIRDGVRQCREAGVAAFVKQIGSKPFDSAVRVPGDDRVLHDPPTEVEAERFFRLCDAMQVKIRDRKGGDMSEWPADLRVREFPEGR